MEYVNKQRGLGPSQMHHHPPPMVASGMVNGTNGLPNGLMAPMSPSQHPNHRLSNPPPNALPPGGNSRAVGMVSSTSNMGNEVNNKEVGEAPPSSLEKDYYGCYCLKFIVKNGTHITEEKVLEDFGQFGEVVDVRGPGLFSGLRGNHVYVRFIEKADAEEALRHLTVKYHQLTPASISDVLPDNYGLYTISFYNKTGIPSADVRREFSNFGEVKNLTGSLDVKGGRVFVSYKEKSSAVQALQAFFFRKEKYPNMKFALPRCEKDYFGCYCLKFYNKSGDITEEKVLRDFGQFGDVVDVRGPGLFDVTGDDVYVRYKEKSSAEQALVELVGKYDSLCLAPPSDIQADKFGYFTITFVNDKCLSKSDVWYIFSKFGTVACVNGTFDCKKGRVFVSYKDKQGALNALETMLITKEYHLQVSKNSTVRKNDYNVVANAKEAIDTSDFNNGDLGGASNNSSQQQQSNQQHQGPPQPHQPRNGDKVSGVVSHHNGLLITNGHAEEMIHQHHLNHVASSSSLHQNGPPPQGPSQPQQQAPPSNQPGLQPQVQPPNLASTQPPQVVASAQQQPQQPPNVSTPNSRHSNRDHSRSREPSLVPVPSNQLSQLQHSMASALNQISSQPPPPQTGQPPPGLLTPAALEKQQQQIIQQKSNNGGLVKFNRNVEKDIFGYFCLSFLNEDGDINEKKVRHDFGKFGEVVSVRGALGKQKGHVFVRFRRKEAAENCLNCLNSFPLSEMSELFGKYLYLSPATPRDIDCDMYGLYSISFLNLNMKSFREIRLEFAKFGEIVRLTSGGSGNTDELVSISYNDKTAAIKALQTHFTNKEFPYLDIAKGSSLLLVNSSDSSDNEEDYHPVNPGNNVHHSRHFMPNGHGPPNEAMAVLPPGLHPISGGRPRLPPGPNNGSGVIGSQISPPRKDPFHDPSPVKTGPSGSDVVDELLKPFQSYFSIYRTGQYHNPLGAAGDSGNDFASNGVPQQSSQMSPPHNSSQQPQRSPDKKYRVKNIAKMPNGGPASPVHHHMNQQKQPSGKPMGPPPVPLPPLDSSLIPVTTAEMVLNGMRHNLPPPQQQQQPQQPQPAAEIIAHEQSPEPEKSPEVIPTVAPQPKQEECTPEPEAVSSTPTREIGPLETDVFGLYSLTFVNKAKDLSERKVRLDFSKYGDVARVRGQFNTAGESIIVSFNEKESAEKAVNSPSMASKYGPSLNTCPFMDVVPDKDGHYSVEFVNSGMSGIREITNEFSKHGEVMKVMAGGAKNAVKRVTVSFADRLAAFEAVNAHENSKDFVAIDFARDCLKEMSNGPASTSS